MHITRYIKNNNKLELVKEQDKILFKQFINKLKENEEVDAIFIIKSTNITNAKLALIHHQIGILASEAGYSFEEMKKEVKRKTGLAVKYADELGNKKEFFRSFSDISQDEVNLVLETCKEIALIYNVIL